MTAKQVYEYALIEINKTEALNLLLDDFNYFANKAIQQCMNKWYTFAEMNQTVDDILRSIKSTAKLKPIKSEAYSLSSGTYSDLYYNTNIYNNIQEVSLPMDYLHILNCVCAYKVVEKYKCYSVGDNIYFGANRLTANSWSTIMKNYYFRPTYKNPYYYIHNVNNSVDLPTNNRINGYAGYNHDSLNNESTESGYITIGTDSNKYDVTYTIDDSNSINIKNEISSNFPRNIIIGGESRSVINKLPGDRFGNPNTIRMELRCGNIPKHLILDEVIIDYLKVPQHFKLTIEQLDSVEDISQIMEYPDYVCYEIIDELVKLILENSSDQRLQTNQAINMTVVPPVQQQSK